jgi:2,3-bisphosphoglycerate-independent phosphoglycerate mutase
MPTTALIVLDGWGIAPPNVGNAVYLAKTPVFDRIWDTYPHTKLEASGRAVGLPVGQIGNSEVGHLNLGAGRVVQQKQTFITALIESGEFFENVVLRDAFAVMDKGVTLHLMGLVSDGGVHSDWDHLMSLLDMSQQYATPNIALHIFTDGRDVGPTTGLNFMLQLEAKVAGLRGVKLASVSGRYYAMDRDKRWERVEKAYNAVVCGKADYYATSAVAAVQAAYERGETDEFIKPTVLVDANNKPVAPIQDGAGIFWFNFRADRTRQLSYALLNADFTGFVRCRVLSNLSYASMMHYADDIVRPYAFELPTLTNVLAEVLAGLGKSQYHSAETEKYPHVTFFFNAQREEPYPGESRHLVPSPKVATYDLQPEMSAPKLAAATVRRILSADDDFMLVNFANPDMVGHTGVRAAAITACETVDEGLGMILKALRSKGGRAIVVADHGNAEVMIDANGGPHTAHTTNLVPCILVDDGYQGTLRGGGKLGDVAPTILELMGIEKPVEMTGESLLER